jgi:hypothetical protein
MEENMDILFDKNAKENTKIETLVREFIGQITPLEKEYDKKIIVFQDGVKGSYYIKCSLLAKDAADLCDLNAKLDVSKSESYRANRRVFFKHETYQKMVIDSRGGREFNDIIVEYNKGYNPESPLKVWGGQHRISAIKTGGIEKNRYHGFKIFFSLSKEQRTEVALISNTNISVSNDTFDRMVEETIFGDYLRRWCKKVGLLDKNEDFPDIGSQSEKITVKLARSFVTNFYKGKERGRELVEKEICLKVYNPYLAKTGATIDTVYEKIMKENNILQDSELLKAGMEFVKLHNAQYKAVKNKASTISNRKTYRNKALVESFITAWSYVAGLLQSHSIRLLNHYKIPTTTKKIPDPLNAKEMSEFKHDQDPPAYRGLGTRSSTKERQRVVQLFLAKSCQPKVIIDKKFMNQAVSHSVGLNAFAKSYYKDF